MLDYCIERAKETPHIKGQQRHYAVIVNRAGRVLSEAPNSYGHSCSVHRHYANKVGKPLSVFNHAETKALSLLKSGQKAYKIYVVRVGAKGKALNSKPCKICERALKDYGIKSVEYTL